VTRCTSCSTTSTACRRRRTSSATRERAGRWSSIPGATSRSACGKNLSNDTQSTIGEQRRTNYTLQPMTEDAFVALVTEGQPLQPVYFSYDARRNRQAHG